MERNTIGCLRLLPPSTPQMGRRNRISSRSSLGWWAKALEGANGDWENADEFTPDVEGLKRFLEEKVPPWFDNRRKELSNRPPIRDQAYGEAHDPDKLERLGRDEVYLDRKLEPTLGMPFRL